MNSKIASAGAALLLCVGCENSDANDGAGGSGNLITVDASADSSDAGADSSQHPENDAGAAGSRGHFDSGFTQDADVNEGAAGSGSRLDAAVDGAIEASPGDGRSCNVVVQQQPDEGKAHAPECDPVSHRSNPPSSGIHYGQVPAFGVYTQPLPRGYWVHSLEHGTVVITYNCPEGCPEETAQAEAAIRSLPLDPMCVRAGIPSRRIIMTPDPLLDTRWAASSWGYTLRATCFDEAAFLTFYRDHVNQGLENLCSYDFNPRTDAGTLDIAPGCGQ